MLGRVEPHSTDRALLDRIPARVDARSLAIAGGLSLFAILLVRTAWVCDDAYITLRTVDNFVHGYGLRWNVDERVQAFTHPLWLLLLSGLYAFTHEAFFTTIAASIALALGGVYLYVSRIALSFEAVLVGLATFIFSKAFVEFSTSGLENPLTTFLLAVFFAIYWSGGRRRGIGLWTTAGLVMLNRLDTGALVLPVLAAAAWRRPWKETLRHAAIGLSPLAAWEIFSVVYFGFPVPNTAYAKLQTGIAAPSLVGQGVLYLIDSISHDPVTLLVTATAMVLCVRAGTGMGPVVAGIALYLVFVVRAGGDFMSGRFLAAPLFCAIAAVGRLRWRPMAPAAGWTVAGIALIGLAATTHPPLTSTADTPVNEFGVSGVADERTFDYSNAGLLRWTRERPLPTGEWVTGGVALRGRSNVVVRANIGLFGYFAGPSPHIVDAYGLSDPLVARLPARQPWRIGHFERVVPEGYVDSIRTGQNRICDRDVAALYDQLKLVTQGRLWTRARWRAIRRLNLGW